MKSILTILLLLNGHLLFAQDDQLVLDEIAAVVNNEIILRSEVDMQAQYVAYTQNQYSVSEDMWKYVLESLIAQKLLLAKAKLDSIQVPSATLENDLDQRINYLVNRLGSEAAVRDYYNKSLLQIRNELRETVENERMVQSIRQKKFGEIGITAPEVEAFYYEFQDSLPIVPNSAELYQIFILPEQTTEAREGSLTKINGILDSIKGGADFGEMAKRYSDDPTSARGGDLGFFKRGELVPAFEEAAYALEPGQISGVVETRFGFHLIQMIERRGESINTRHILVRADAEALDHEGTIQKLREWKQKIESGEETFRNLASKYSKDEFAKNGGFMGRIALENMTETMQTLVQLTPEGKISEPAQIQSSSGQIGYHIVYVQAKIPEHQMNLTDDYIQIQNFALEYKRNQLFEQWIEDIKKEVYLDIRVSGPGL